MAIYYKTHLDMAQPFVSRARERLPQDFPPPLGSLIEFWNEEETKCFSLEVVGIVFDTREREYRVDLHTPKCDYESIKDWEERFRRHMLGRMY